MDAFLFLLLVWLLWLGLPLPCCIRVVKADIPVMFQIVREMILVFINWIYVGCRFRIYTPISFTMWRYVPSISTLLRNFIKIGAGFYWMPFLYLLIYNHVVLSLILFMSYIMFIGLQILCQRCTPQNKTHLIMMYNLLMYCWIQFTNILLRIISAMFIRDIDL